MPWRSRARGRAARALPVAGSGVDRGTVPIRALVVGREGKNRSHASGLGARGGRRPCCERGEAIRRIGVDPRRPAFYGSARDRRARLGSRRGAGRNRTDSGLARSRSVYQGQGFLAWDAIWHLSPDRLEADRAGAQTGLGPVRPRFAALDKSYIPSGSAPPRLLAAALGLCRRATELQ